MRHNSLRDTTAELLRQVCKDVEPEPQLLPVAGVQLPNGTNIADEARLDVSARSFWSPLDRAFIDIRVPHPKPNQTVKRALPKCTYHMRTVRNENTINGSSI